MSKLPKSAWKSIAALGVTAALFVPLLLVGGPAFAKTGAAASEYGHSGSSQYQYKVQICHRTHSKKHPFVLINVSSRSANARLKHGDVLPVNGVCPTTAPPSTKHHGNDDNQGNDNNHGKHKGNH